LNTELKVVYNLREAINHTLSVNPNLEAMRYNRDVLYYEVRNAYGGYLPHLNVTAGAGGGWKEEKSPGQPFNQRDFTDRLQGGVSLSQLLFDGWRTPGKVAQNEALLDSGRKRYLTDAEVYSLNSIVAYMESWRNWGLVELAEQNVQTHGTILNSLNERQRLGAGSAADVVQTQARLSRAESTLEERMSAADISVAGFLRTVGAMPSPELQLPEDPHPLLPPSVEAFVRSTLENNPKIKSYQKDIEAAQYGVTIARSALFPEFFAVASANTDTWHNAEWETNDYSMMITMRWNLFAGMSDVNAIKAAASRVRESESNLRALEYQLRQEAQAAWREYMAANRMVQLMESTVAYNDQTREYYRQQFEVGQRSLLDVLDAENEYFANNSLLLTYRANEYIAIYRLAAMRGALLSSLGIDPALYEIDLLPVNGGAQARTTSRATIN
jgi:adhesin transport system outer membrane protein